MPHLPEQMRVYLKGLPDYITADKDTGILSMMDLYP